MDPDLRAPDAPPGGVMPRSGPEDDAKLQQILCSIERLADGATGEDEREAAELSRLLVAAAARGRDGGGTEEDAAPEQSLVEGGPGVERTPPLPESELDRARRAAASQEATRISSSRRRMGRSRQ